MERSADCFSEAEWREAFAGQAKDGHYHSVVESTICGDFDYRYLGIHDASGRLRVLQPMFVTDQDLVVGIPAFFRAIAAAVRRVFPRFLFQRMLMAGCAAGEGHAGLLGDRAKSAEALLQALEIYARHRRASIVTLKDFPKVNREWLDAPAAAQQYRRIPSFPATTIDLRDLRNFDDYLERRVGKATRKSLRRKFRLADAIEPRLTMEVRSEVGAEAHELCALYRQVLDRSEFRFEELTPEYFIELGRRMPGSARFFIWRAAGRPVAVSATLIHNGRIYDNYLGMDYALAYERHLYFVTLRDMINYAIDDGVETYYSTPLDYEPKRSLRFRIAPLDLYVKFVNRAINPLFRRVLPFLEPTRYDRTLRRFENAKDMD